MAGRWMMATIQTTFAVMPAPSTGSAGSHSRTARTRSRCRRWSPSRPCRRGCSSRSARCSAWRSTCRPRSRSSTGSSSTSTSRSTSRSAPTRRELTAVGDVAFEHVWFRYGGDAWTLEDVSFTVPAGTKTALVGETGSGKTTLGYLAARLYDVERGRVSIGGVDVRDLTFASLAGLVGVVSQETYLFHATVRENLRFAKPDATDDEVGARGRGRADPRPDRVAARRATTPSSASAATASRAARSSGSRSRGRSCATRRSSSSTRRRARSTPRPSARCRRRSTGSPRAARRSRSPTASRRSPTPTRSSSSTAGGSSSAARHDELVALRRPLRGARRPGTRRAAAALD